MHPLLLYGIAITTSVVYMTLVWLLSLRRRNASIVDSFWGPGFIVVAVLALVTTGVPTWREALVLGLVTAWGTRLSAYVTIRNRGKGEDWRYRQWREKSPQSFWWKSYGKVFLVQAILLVLVASPIFAVATSPEPRSLTTLDAVGTALWLFGFFFEAIGDAQLRRFKKDPAHLGKVCDRGLWRFTRHPNYFGESMLWWGIFLVAMSTPTAAWSVIGPTTITFLLLRVSGVRMLEKGLSERKPQYADYVRRTSAFFPWPPRGD
jgi:steroid 5-alpha reductase family enzyme